MRFQDREYHPAHFASPKSRGARNECAHCKGKGCWGEIKMGICWIPLCRGCYMIFWGKQPIEDHGPRPFPEFKGVH